MSQGYLASGGRVSVRVRIAGDEAWLNIKAGGLVASRPGVRVSRFRSTKRASFSTLAEGPLIDKTRHFVVHGGMTWEIDEFHGDNSGLVVAELELEREDEQFPHPPWLGDRGHAAAPLLQRLPRHASLSRMDRSRTQAVNVRVSLARADVDADAR